MNYIILDMEWNQAPCAERTIRRPVPLTGEIIQFGAVKLSDSGEILDEFMEYVRPKYYTKLKREITKLTGITKDRLDGAQPFPLVFYEFRQWCGEDSLLFTWGNDDVRMLQNNLLFHGMDQEEYPKHYDLQLIYSFQVLGETAQHSLASAMEHFDLHEDESRPAHDALNDAYYTAQICRRLDIPSGLLQYRDHLSVWMSHAPDTVEKVGVFPDKLLALRTRAVRGCRCPVCKAPLDTPKWISQGSNKKLVVITCPEHGSYLCRMIFQRVGTKGFAVVKEAYRLDDELHRFYQSRLEQWTARIRRRHEETDEELV